MSTKFFTNFGQNTLFKKFEGIFAYNKDIQFFDALVGFFRSSGYFAIRPFLEDVPHIRILIGINVDKIISKYHAKGLLFQTDTQQAKKEFIQDIKADIQNSEYTKNVEKGIVQFIEDVISKKIEIKAHPTRNLHAKIYIFRPENFSEHQPGSIITGSSNLTGAGIGSSNESNYEFNVILHDYDDIKFASDEFQMLWDEGVPILPQEIQNVEKDTFIKAEPTPFELYIKFLIEYFGKSVEFDPNSITDLPKGFYRLSYQIDSVNQGFDLLQKHNGFFLADVVGLGKTVVTTLIAKIFFYSNDYPSHITKTLVIFPPGLKDNWLNTFDQFGLQNYDWITNGSIHRVKNPERYDLIIVDEAHKFRNDTAEAYTALQLLCKTPTSHILPDGTKAMKKVVLVSATPLNNRPADIRNQLLLFQDAKDSTLDISNLQSYFARKIEDYKRAARESDTGKMQSMIAVIYADIRDKIIEPITIRRTRADLLDHEQYRKDLEEQGIRFPNVEKPRKIYYQLDAVLEALYDHTIKKISNPSKGLQYYRYRAIEFLIPSIKQKYKNADLLSSQLANIMKTLLVKRIDSSFCAFKISLKRFFKASKAMVKMFNDNKIYIAPNLNVTDYILDDNEEELIHQIENARETDPTITVCNPEDFLPAFIEGLKRDHDILKKLVDGWERIDVENNDPKIDEFIFKLENELLDTDINPEKKLIIFSESKDTVNHVTRQLNGKKFGKILSISADNRNQFKDIISENFDANIDLEKQKNEYQLLISTEVLAEGINLHRANVVVNYDTPWNSTRLMQRIGRVNRIGTKAQKIFIYNFYPTAKVDDDIELKKKAIMKLQAFHSALGEDSQIYSPDEIMGTFGLFDKTIEEEKDERLAYLMELRRFKEKNPEYFRGIKKYPLRSRVGRKNSELSNETACFIRNQRRDVFYKIQEDNNLTELSFVETAKLFKTTSDEPAVSLHAKHHDQINLAVDDFNRKLQTEFTENQAVDTHQSPLEKRALAYLDAFLKFDFLDEEEIRRIKAAKRDIKAGKFQSLQRDVNRLKKSQKTMSVTPTVLTEKLLQIINKYPLNIEDEDDINPVVTVRYYEQIRPEIILSESFSE